MNIATS